MQHGLASLGWNEFFARRAAAAGAPEHAIMRVVVEHRGGYQCHGRDGERRGELDGTLRRAARLERPCVGDWVVGDDAGRIHQRLERRSLLVRRAAGPVTEAQPVAANVDRVFIVTSPNGDFNVRRIERYLAAVWESGATPIVVLNKIDLCADLRPFVDGLAAAAEGVPILLASAQVGAGLDALRAHVPAGCTVAFVGSSGVGKSTLINGLVGAARQSTSAVREHDDRGCHTTTRRELMLVPGGGAVIDTPGMRELGLWSDDGSGLERTFADVTALASGCRFRDCRHANEPGCAVRAAVDDGRLDAARLASLHKLEREQAFHERQVDAGARLAERRRVKLLNREARARSRWKQT